MPVYKYIFVEGRHIVHEQTRERILELHEVRGMVPRGYTWDERPGVMRRQGWGPEENYITFRVRRRAPDAVSWDVPPQ